MHFFLVEFFFPFLHFIGHIFEMDSTNSATSPHSIINRSNDSSSPYYLHPNDNHGALLVLEIFLEDNYIAWSHLIAIALTVKNKVAFIDGLIIAPSAH